MRRLVLLGCLLVLAVACGGGEASPPEAVETPTEATATSSGPVVRIETEAGEVEVAVEIADTPDERQRGLMFRESLPEDAGMIFLFDEDSSGGFWMKNTLIPLSIAFAGADGTIRRILDMEPCEEDPCPIYDPGVFYRQALEVNKGAFERWGVAGGDRLTLER
ncbi:MAG TPA: DUF192 domain-containing protein [Gaiellaceae bacterium]|nr:DUF192 domain-containing protein [Gaiellaceae bacterium]